MADAHSTTQTEIREIPDFPNYRIRSDGHVLTTTLDRGRRRLPPGEWRVCNGQRHTGGYKQILLHRDGRRYVRYVHRLVLENFVGPCPEGMEACHNNGDRTDNRLENLRWDTRTNNHADKAAHGTLLKGSRVPNSKLKEEHIPIIKALAEAGVLQWQIAQAFGVEQSNIAAILRGITWKHVV